MTSFMKVDTYELPVLPANLLAMKRPLPLEIKGLGQLCRTYDTFGYASCAPNRLPLRQTTGSVGHILYSEEKITLKARCDVVVCTGLSVQLPEGHYGKIEGLTSMAYAHSIVPFGTVIDQDYHNVIKVKLFNMSNVDYVISKNDRIAQLVVQKYTTPIFRHVGSWGDVGSCGGKFGPIGPIGSQGGFGPTSR